MPEKKQVARDPRVDPKPGDVLKRGNRIRKVLIPAYAFHQYLEVGETRKTGRRYVPVMPTFPWVSQWRQWAKDAEVITAAE